MIDVKIYKNRNFITGFQVKGHSNFYKKFFNKFFYKLGIKRKDYICSAVSAISYMTLISLKEVFKKDLEYKIDETGFFECKLKKGYDKSTENIFNSFLLTLELIQKEYPGNIIVKEVKSYGT